MIGILSDLFTTMNYYNVLPDNFNTMLPKPVLNKPSLCHDIKNVRPIAISDTISNIFEYVLLDKISKSSKQIDEQFGFKPNSSCNHAVFVAKETIFANTRKGRGVRVVALDASMAFDLILRDGMFHKLKDQMPFKTWRTPRQYYNVTKMKIENKSEQ